MADLPSDFSGTKTFSWGLDKIAGPLSSQRWDFPRNHSHQLLAPLAGSSRAVLWALKPDSAPGVCAHPSWDSPGPFQPACWNFPLSLWSWEWKCLLRGSQWHFKGPTDWEPDRNVGGTWAGLPVHWAEFQLSEAKQSLIMANIWFSERVDGSKTSEGYWWNCGRKYLMRYGNSLVVQWLGLQASWHNTTLPINEVKRNWKK